MTQIAMQNRDRPWGIAILAVVAVCFVSLAIINSFPGRVTAPVVDSVSRKQEEIAFVPDLPNVPDTSPSELLIEVAGLGEFQGECLVAVYDSAQSFNKTESAISLVAVPVKEASIRLQFDDIAAETVAIAAFHDQNSNKVLDKNVFGIPTEPYGFSNNPTSSFGPPSYKAAVVRDWRREPKPISILLKKLN